MSDGDEQEEPGFWDRIMRQFTDKEPAELLKEGTDWASEKYDAITHQKDLLDSLENGSLGDVGETATEAAKDFAPHDRAKEDLDSLGKVFGGLGDRFDRTMNEAIDENGPQEHSAREQWLDRFEQQASDPVGYVGGGALRRAVELRQSVEDLVDHGKERLDHLVDAGSELYHGASDAVHEYMAPAPVEEAPAEPELPPDVVDPTLDPSFGQAGAALDVQDMWHEVEQEMIAQGATSEDIAAFHSLEDDMQSAVDSATVNGEFDADLFAQQQFGQYLDPESPGESPFDDTL